MLCRVVEQRDKCEKAFSSANWAIFGAESERDRGNAKVLSIPPQSHKGSKDWIEVASLSWGMVLVVK